MMFYSTWFTKKYYINQNDLIFQEYIRMPEYSAIELEMFYVLSVMRLFISPENTKG